MSLLIDGTPLPYLQNLAKTIQDRWSAPEADPRFRKLTQETLSTFAEEARPGLQHYMEARDKCGATLDIYCRTEFVEKQFFISNGKSIVLPLPTKILNEKQAKNRVLTQIFYIQNPQYVRAFNIKEIAKTAFSFLPWIAFRTAPVSWPEYLVITPIVSFFTNKIALYATNQLWKTLCDPSIETEFNQLVQQLEPK